MAESAFPAILLVEDERDILIVLRRILRDLTTEHDIVAVPDAPSALAALDKQPFALVITDYVMPEMSGLELARAVRARSPKTAIIMVTAYATPEIERNAHAAGVEAVLRKPFLVGRLEEVVRAALDRWETGADAGQNN
jgi:two-component system, response regulator, stage 0 sporulation protein F